MRSVALWLAAAGAMAARGLLENPAMFAGYDATPIACVADYLRIAIDLGSSLKTMIHHIGTMTERSMTLSGAFPSADAPFVHCALTRRGGSLVALHACQTAKCSSAARASRRSWTSWNRASGSDHLPTPKP